MSRCGDWRWENMNIGEWEYGDQRWENAEIRDGEMWRGETGDYAQDQRWGDAEIRDGGICARLEVK